MGVFQVAVGQVLMVMRKGKLFVILCVCSQLLLTQWVLLGKRT